MEASWHETVGPHFTLLSDVEPSQARATVVQLEQLLAAYLRLGWSTEQFPGRVEVVMLADATQFRQLYPHLKGYYLTGEVIEPVMITTAEGGDEGLEVLAHELNHHIALSALPGQPQWFAEGTATFFQTAYFDDEGRFVLGAVPKGRYAELAALGMMPASMLLSGQHGDDPRFYASAWALTHYLMMRRGEAFAAFQRSLATGMTAFDAWTTAFPDLTHELVDQTLRAYLETAEFDNHHLPFERPAVHVTTRPLPEADGHAFTALAYGGASQAPAARTAANTSLRAAFELDPHPLRAQLVELLLAPDAARRLRLAQTLVRAHPGDFRAWLALGLAQEVHSGSPEWHRGLRSEVVQHLALLQPDHPRVLALGALEALERADSSQALRLSARAMRAAPLDVLVLGVRAAALAANGEELDACMLVRRARVALSERPGSRNLPPTELEVHCQRQSVESALR